MTNQQALTFYFQRVIRDIREDQGNKGMTTSGNSAASLKFSVSESSGSLTGSSYFYQQIFGRKPGKFAPPDEILAWIVKKGITPRDSKTSMKSLAYLINRKLARKGSDIFLGKKQGISFLEITGGENMNKLVSDLTESKVNEVVTFIKSQLEKPV